MDRVPITIATVINSEGSGRTTRRSLGNTFTIRVSLLKENSKTDRSILALFITPTEKYIRGNF